MEIKCIPLLSSSAPQSSWGASVHTGCLCNQDAVFGKMIIEYPWCLIERPACHDRYPAMGITGMCENAALTRVQHIHTYFIPKYNNKPSVSKANTQNDQPECTIKQR